MDMELLKTLSLAFGPSGGEEPVARFVMDEVREFADDVKRDALGNVIAVKKGSGNSRIMIAAHMDQPGFIVMEADSEGHLRFSDTGSLNPYSILHRAVIFKDGAEGIGACDAGRDVKNLKTEDMFIDAGSDDRDEALKMAGIGSLGIVRSEFSESQGLITSRALDNRMGCYVLVQALKRIVNPRPSLYFAFTVHGEGYKSGAAAAAYEIEPDMALLVDAAEVESKGMISLGKGPVIRIKEQGMVYSHSIREALEDTGKRHNIKYQYHISDEEKTEAHEIFTSKRGVPLGMLGIPLKYAGSAVERAHSGDIEDTLELLADFLSEYR
jgi:endoglucanase